MKVAVLIMLAVVGARIHDSRMMEAVEDKNCTPLLVMIGFYAFQVFRDIQAGATDVAVFDGLDMAKALYMYYRCTHSSEVNFLEQFKNFALTSELTNSEKVKQSMECLSSQY